MCNDLSNDISKRLMIRFKKSKDFDRTIEKLKKEGFNVETERIKRKRYIKVLKDKKELIYIVYEDLEDFKDTEEYEYYKEKGIYKQNIIAMYY